MSKMFNINQYVFSEVILLTHNYIYINEPLNITVNYVIKILQSNTYKSELFQDISSHIL